ncbi:hypothetical protein ACFL4W_02070 [Planctomycetota bacterium]
MEHDQTSGAGMWIILVVLFVGLSGTALTFMYLELDRTQARLEESRLKCWELESKLGEKRIAMDAMDRQLVVEQVEKLNASTMNESLKRQHEKYKKICRDLKQENQDLRKRIKDLKAGSTP